MSENHNTETEARVRGVLNEVAINNLLDAVARENHATHRDGPTVTRTLDVHSNPPGLSVEDLAWCKGFGRSIYDELVTGLAENAKISVAMVAVPPGLKFTRPTRVW